VLRPDVNIKNVHLVAANSFVYILALDCLYWRATVAKMAVLDNRAVVSTVAIAFLVWLLGKTAWLLKDRQRVKKFVSCTHCSPG
jgi:hypothetical protein